MTEKKLEAMIKVNEQGEILFFNKDAEAIFAPAICVGLKIDQIIKGVDPEGLFRAVNIIETIGDQDYCITSFLDEDSRAVFYLIQDLDIVFEKVEKTKRFFGRQLDFILKVMDNENDLTITDDKGIIIKVSDSYEGHFDIRKEDIIGRSIYDIEKAGVFSPSVTAIVLAEKKKITILQKNSRGDTTMVTGVPIFNEKGDLQYVVSFNSIDIAGISTFQEKYEKLNEFMDRYYDEIKELRLKEIGFWDIVSKSAVMENLFKTIINIADVNVNVLLTGETGVGKSLIAKLIHTKSARAHKKYIDLNCGAIPDSLLESELFGYEKGSFTGANAVGKIGLIELANGGTLFLDEIAELPYHLQRKLLQVIQDKKIMRVGSTKYIDVDFRLIAATNKNLRELVDKGAFREDLYYRLNVIPIHIPALKARKDDILPLITRFLEDFNKKYKKNKHFSQGAIEAMINYGWPGNVRELENTVERLVLTTLADEIDTANLPENINEKREIYFESTNLGEIIDNYEKQIFQQAYKKYRTTTEIANALGIGQSSVVRKLQKYIEGYNKK